MQQLLIDINHHKVIKNFSDKFGIEAGKINITTLTAAELSELTATLYNKVLFLGDYHEDMPDFSGQKEKYQKYFNQLFDKLKDVCVEINNRNIGVDEVKKVKLPIASVNFTEGVRAGIARIDAAVPPEQTPKQIFDSILIHGIDGEANTARGYKGSQAFQHYQSEKKNLLKQHFAEKKIEYYTLKCAMDLGLKFSRADGEDDSLKKYTQKLAKGFNPKKSWLNRNKPNFLKTSEQKLYESLKKVVEENIDNIEPIMTSKMQFVAKQALFSLKDSTIYTKLKAHPVEEFTSLEKLLLQRRLTKFLKYTLDGVDPFEPPYKQFSRFMKQRGFLGEVGLLALGLIPPFSIIFAPSAADHFQTWIFAYPLKASYWLTKPFRVVLEYGVMIPLEAPLKVVEAAKKAIFYSDEFDQGQNVFQRFKKSLGDQKFGEMRSFHRGYAEEMQEVRQQINHFEGKSGSAPEINVDNLRKNVVQNTRHAMKFTNGVEKKGKAINVAKKGSADGFNQNF